MVTRWKLKAEKHSLVVHKAKTLFFLFKWRVSNNHIFFGIFFYVLVLLKSFFFTSKKNVVIKALKYTRGTHYYKEYNCIVRKYILSCYKRTRRNRSRQFNIVWFIPTCKSFVSLIKKKKGTKNHLFTWSYTDLRGMDDFMIPM
jgi:hypothetical protein